MLWPYKKKAICQNPKFLTTPLRKIYLYIIINNYNWYIWDIFILPFYYILTYLILVLFFNIYGRF